MANRVCEALGIEYPVIQGAMAWTAMAPLVAAVSEAGGLGVLGSGFMPKPIIIEQANAVRSMTSKPFAANIFLDPGPQLEEAVSAIEDAKIPVAYIDSLNLLELDFTTQYYKRLHDAGCKVVAKVNYLEDALVAEKAGADVIIVKGVDGGGHCTKVSARVLLAEVCDAVKSVPVVASGGIATPRQAAGCTVVGAEGIEMGIEKGRVEAIATVRPAILAEGIEQGIEKGHAKVLTELLNIRFGNVPQSVLSQIEHIDDSSKVANLIKSMYQVDSLDEFKKFLN